jgi:hypothetical protein
MRARGRPPPGAALLPVHPRQGLGSAPDSEQHLLRPSSVRAASQLTTPKVARVLSSTAPRGPKSPEMRRCGDTRRPFLLHSSRVPGRSSTSPQAARAPCRPLLRSPSHSQAGSLFFCRVVFIRCYYLFCWCVVACVPVFPHRRAVLRVGLLLSKFQEQLFKLKH